MLKSTPAPVSLNALAKEAELRSHKVALSYLTLLEQLYVVRTLPYIDPYALEEVPRKEKKIHLADPLLYQVFAQWTATSKPSDAALLEAVVATHLGRREGVGYWRNSFEIDVVVPRLGLGVEVSTSPKRGKAKIGRIKVKYVDLVEAAVFLLSLPEEPAPAASTP